MPQQQVPRELAPLVETIGRLLERVRSTIARERRFTDDAAHELRTPLTAVKTHLQVLRLSLGRQVQPAVADALAHADEGVLRMQRSLEQLLLLARLEAGEEAPLAAACNPEAAAHAAIKEVEASCRCPGRIEVDVQAPLNALGVPDSLVVSGVRNLLENAVRASPLGSEIRLEVTLDPQACVVFRVLDRGPGMTEEELAQAARRFWRRGRTGQGTGLGLSIVDAIAKRYGGSLRLSSRPGGGLCAELVLPVLTEPACPVATARYPADGR